jgi:proline iminopeptidase
MNNTIKPMLYCLFIMGLLTPAAVTGQESGFTETDDGVIHYQTYGSGYPLLIINGGPGLDCEGFSTVAELFSDHYMSILFDQRGTGESTLNKVDNTTVTMDKMIEDIETLRHHLGFEQWVVLGHSFGGFLAQHYASSYPDSISGMILSGSGGIDLEIFDYFGANTNIRLSKEEQEAIKYWDNEIKNGDTSHHAKLEKMKALASAYLYNKDYIPKLAERLTQGNPQIQALVYEALKKGPYDCKESLKTFTKPVLIIQGRQDIVGSGTAYKAHKILPNSRLVFLNECVHYGWLDQREQYKAEIEKFLEPITTLYRCRM